MGRRKTGDFDQELLDLYDSYAHGLIERRGFLDKAAKFAIGGITAMALLDALSPNYALARQVEENDPRTCTRASTTVSITTPRSVTTKPPPSSPSGEPSTSSAPSWLRAYR
jgi:hypothetical protein